MKPIAAYPHASATLLARTPSQRMHEELAIAPSLFHFSRDALHAYFARFTGVVWMPSFHCGMEVRAACDAGLTPRFYRINSDFTIDEDDLARGVRAEPGPVLVIHYFGFPQRIPALDVPIIEDCSHAFLTRNVGTLGDAATFSLYKTLGTADGGAMRGAVTSPPRMWIAQHARKPYYNDAHRFDELAANAERRIFEGAWQYGRGISRTSLALIRRIDPDFVREKRRHNYQRLAALIGNAPPLHDDACPLFLPIVVRDRKKLWRELQEQHIDTFIFGMFHHPLFDAGRFPETRAMRENILCLPIHQDLDHADLERIARHLP
ncbi:MAG TPA: DegT/DnrJ/EryC1/StrS family aminotransferase [Thermoanaerobaculia bacterium]|nr:DegT/DnrJ/EryC1/StrS family aminotransferase [Thermoanaerobaculia bacterium]